MKTISGKQFCRILRKRGWTLNHIKGSHHIYDPPPELTHLAPISVPVHGNQDLKIGIQTSLMKDAEITANDL